MTKNIFAKSVGKAIPVIEAFVSGGLTLATFVPMAKRLQRYLFTLPIADVEFYKQSHEDDIIDIDLSDIIDDDFEE
ncbi:MAG: hypothetical protein J1F11_06310 [Oscillospiraceae bacterium]|nr:hypothetical protein [Oscillospiraceae bacterium]